MAKRTYTVKVTIEVDHEGYCTEYGLHPPVDGYAAWRRGLILEVQEWLDGIVDGSTEAALRPFDFAEVVT